MRMKTLGGPLLLGMAAAGCNGDPEDTDTGEPALEHQFSFAILADPHIVGNPDHAARLTAAVEWINGEAQGRSIELVFVLGDIAWGNGFGAARDMLDDLSMPYLPLTGDNEIQVGNEEDYDTAWAPHYLAVAPEHRLAVLIEREDGQFAEAGRVVADPLEELIELCAKRVDPAIGIGAEAVADQP